MALATNGQMVFATGARFFGASAYLSSYNHALVDGATQTGRRRNLTAGQGITSELVGIPSGYRHPGAWLPPQKAGALAARNTITGAGSASATAQSGYNIGATITGSGGVSDATVGLIVSIAAAIVGSGGVSAADTKALATMIATITGSGTVTATAAGLADLAATLTGSGSVNATNSALMQIAATIRGYGEASAEGVRDAVWNALASTLTTPGTAGAALLAAGSAGDPWSTPLPGAYAAGSAGAMLAALINGLTPEQLAQLVDIWQRLGLDPANPLVTSATAIAAGDVQQSIAEAGGSVTVTREP